MHPVRRFRCPVCSCHAQVRHHPRQHHQWHHCHHHHHQHRNPHHHHQHRNPHHLPVFVPGSTRTGASVHVTMFGKVYLIACFAAPSTGRGAAGVENDCTQVKSSIRVSYVRTLLSPTRSMFCICHEIARSMVWLTGFVSRITRNAIGFGKKMDQYGLFPAEMGKAGSVPADPTMHHG